MYSNELSLATPCPDGTENSNFNGKEIGGESKEKKVSSKAKLVRYTLSLPTSLWTHLQKIADEECTSVLEIIRKFIKLGFVVVDVNKNGGKLVLEQGGERTIVKLI